MLERKNIEFNFFRSLRSWNYRSKTKQAPGLPYRLRSILQS